MTLSLCFKVDEKYKRNAKELMKMFSSRNTFLTYVYLLLSCMLLLIFWSNSVWIMQIDYEYI